jgi:peptide-methionine (R)-S-oxide reductase
MTDRTAPKTEQEWRAMLGPERFEVTRKGGTERAFTGRFYEKSDDGRYLCVCCDHPLFTSETKYASGSGWPSFYQPVTNSSVRLVDDTSHGMHRVEVRCGRCDAHLGHVFPDGPAPTGERYCINSLSLAFESPTGDREEG